MLADDLGNCQARLLLIKNGYDLSFAESFGFHVSSPFRKVKQNPLLFTGVPLGEANSFKLLEEVNFYKQIEIDSLFLSEEIGCVLNKLVRTSII